MSYYTIAILLAALIVIRMLKRDGLLTRATFANKRGPNSKMEGQNF